MLLLLGFPRGYGNATIQLGTHCLGSAWGLGQLGVGLGRAGGTNILVISEALEAQELVNLLNLNVRWKLLAQLFIFLYLQCHTAQLFNFN